MEITSKLPGVGTTIFSVMTRKAIDRGAVNLAQGFPDIPVPERLQALLHESVAAGENQYAPMHGVQALREAIAAKVRGLHDRPVDPETEVTVTSGATEALFGAIQATVTGGDEVIVLDPAYDAYEPAVRLAGGVPVRIPLVEQTFDADWQRLQDTISPRTRMIIVNTPHNPTGAVLDEADLDRLAGMLRGTSILVLSDEVYEHMVFDGEQHRSLLRHEELAARSFVVSSFGKTYHCTGWKIGYCVAPAVMTNELRRVHQFVTFATMTPAQHALARFMTEHPEHHHELGGFYQAKRDRFAAHLERAGFRLRPTPGTYFQLADYGDLSDLDDVAFADHLIEHAGLAAIPLSPFYSSPPEQQQLLRFCFAKRDETLDAAGERLCRI